MSEETAAPFDIEVFFDGECPLCAREIRMLQKLDKRDRIRATDIAAADFDAKSLGITFDALMDTIHGRLPTGEIVSGVEVFRRLYTAVGFGPVVALTRVWGVRQSLDLAYRLFAKNRLRLTGRCDKDGVCRVKNHAHHASPEVHAHPQ